MSAPVSESSVESEASETEASNDSSPVHQNIESIVAFYMREDEKISRTQRILERLSNYLEQPIYPMLIIFAVLLWIAGNEIEHLLGKPQFDPPPYPWLQGLIALGGLLTAAVVLIKQRRLGKLAERRAHLDLQVNLLAEQKTTKLIALIEELRRDLPMVKNRLDAEASAMQKRTDPEAVLSALDEHEKPTPKN